MDAQSDIPFFLILLLSKRKILSNIRGQSSWKDYEESPYEKMTFTQNLQGPSHLPYGLQFKLINRQVFVLAWKPINYFCIEKFKWIFLRLKHQYFSSPFSS